MDIIFGILCAVLNRARGTKLYGYTESTTIGRIVGMGGIATLAHISMLMHEYGFVISTVASMWVFAGLMLWCIPAWDDLWSAAIGNDPKHSRLWGLYHLTLRMGYGMPCIIGLQVIIGNSSSFWALGCYAMGLPYYFAGFLKHKYTIMVAEMSVGAIWWVMISGVLGS